MKISILNTGTELTTGQIINKNSAWIAQTLKKQGLDTQLHLTVPDDKNAIFQALQFGADQTEVIFITGGLGPTSDDFTRDVISEWTSKKLIFDEKSWTQIQQILSSRGVEIKESQKQQCYFPEGSEILKNNKGTANAFTLDHKIQNKNIKLFILPGPPLEIEAIWNDHIQNWIEKATVYVDKVSTHSWDTLGLPESEVASLTESALTEMKKDFPITMGYRVHLPYVEVKMSYPTSADFTAHLFKNKVDQALQKITVLRNSEKITDHFSKLTKNIPFAFYDFSTHGRLHQVLSASLSQFPNWMWKQSEETMDTDFFIEEENFLALFNNDEGHGILMADLNGKKILKTIEFPPRFLSMPDRKAMYFSEMALIEFVRYYGK